MLGDGDLVVGLERLPIDVEEIVIDKVLKEIEKVSGRLKKSKNENEFGTS